MALRIRKDGTIWCAAITEELSDDVYVDDALHYEMSVVQGIICTYPEPHHTNSGGQWFFSNNAPKGCDMQFTQRRSK